MTAPDPSPSPGPPVRFAVEDGVATITLDAPHNRNALSKPLVDAIVAHLAASAADDTVRAVVLTHTGGTFCAGADLAEMAAEGGPDAGTVRLVGLLRALLDHPRPVVAAVDGHVRAGGLGLLGACDVAVAGPSSTFAFTESRLGLAPAIISLTVRTRLPDRAVSRWFLTGETFGPAEAARTGLVTVATDDVTTAVDELAAAFRACSPQGLAESKRLANREVLAAFDRDAEELTALSARLFASDEAQEGIAAFRERRPPRWAPPA